MDLRPTSNEALGPEHNLDKGPFGGSFSSISSVDSDNIRITDNPYEDSEANPSPILDDVFVVASTEGLPVFENKKSMDAPGATRTSRAGGARATALRELMGSRREQTLRWLSSCHCVRQQQSHSGGDGLAGSGGGAQLAADTFTPPGSAQHVHIYASLPSDLARAVASFVDKVTGGCGNASSDSIITQIDASPAKFILNVMNDSSRLSKVPSQSSSLSINSLKAAVMGSSADLASLPACAASLTARASPGPSADHGDIAAHAKVRDNIRQMFELCLLPSVHLVPCTRAEACLACGDLPRVQASLFAAELEEEAWRQCTGGYARTDRASISSYEKRCRTTIHNLREQTYAAAVLAFISAEIDAAAFINMQPSDLLKFASRTNSGPVTVTASNSVVSVPVEPVGAPAQDGEVTLLSKSSSGQQQHAVQKPSAPDGGAEEASTSSTKGMESCSATVTVHTEIATTLEQKSVDEPVITVPDSVACVSVPLPMGQPPLPLAAAAAAQITGGNAASKPKFVASVMSLLQNPAPSDTDETPVVPDDAARFTGIEKSASSLDAVTDLAFDSFQSFTSDFSTCNTSSADAMVMETSTTSTPTADLIEETRNALRSSNRVSRSRSPPAENLARVHAPENNIPHPFYDKIPSIKHGKYNSRSRSRTRSRSRSPGYRYSVLEAPGRRGGTAETKPFEIRRESPPRRRKRSLSRSPSYERLRGARRSGNANTDRGGGRDTKREARDVSSQRSSAISSAQQTSYYVPEGSSSDSDEDVDVKTKLDAIMRGSVPISDGMKRSRR